MRLSTQKIVTVGLFIAGALVFLTWVPDDAYISFRYALNLSEGHGLVFNPGERVEGYSNFLWTLVLGLGHKAGLDIVIMAQVLSILFALATVLLSLRLFDFLAGDVAGTHTYRSHLWAVSLTLVVSLPMVYWATSGLETFAAAFFLILGAFLHIRAIRDERPELHVGSILSYLMVAVLRPEGILYFVVNAIVVGLTHRQRLPRAVKITFAVSFFLFIAFIASRSLYYHALVPNTYWAKPSTAIGYTAPLAQGIRYLLRYSIVSGLILMLPLTVLAFFGRSVRYTVRYLGGLLIVQLAFITWVGGDVLRFDRFTVAFHPVLLALVLASLVWWESSRGKSGWLRAGVWGAVIIALTLNGMRIHRAWSKYCVHDWMHAHFHADLGRTLGKFLPPNSTLVFNEMGATPYYSGLITYDMIGLTDETIGHLIYESYRTYGTTATVMCQRGISTYLLDKEPSCIILPSFSPIDLTGFTSLPDAFHPIWYGIYSHPEFQKAYRAEFSVTHSENKRLHIYVRRGLELNRSALEAMPVTDCLEVTIYH